MLYKREYSWPTVFFPVGTYPDVEKLRYDVHESFVENQPLPAKCFLVMIRATKTASANTKKQSLLKCLARVTGEQWSCI